VSANEVGLLVAPPYRLIRRGWIVASEQMGLAWSPGRKAISSAVSHA